MAEDVSAESADQSDDQMSTRAIRWSTAFAVLCVATVAAVVSYDHAYALVRAHGEEGLTARLVPLTVDGLIYASSMVMLHSARRRVPVPRLARWLLALGILATLAANAAHGLGNGVVGAVVAAWPAVALVGSYELLMLLIRSTSEVRSERREPEGVPTVHVVSADVPEPDSLQVRAASVFAEEIAAGRMPTVRTIRARMRVGQPRAQLVRAYLSQLLDTSGPVLVKGEEPA